jgi:hypothetical protein
MSARAYAQNYSDVHFQVSSTSRTSIKCNQFYRNQFWPYFVSDIHFSLGRLVGYIVYKEIIDGMLCIYHGIVFFNSF